MFKILGTYNGKTEEIDETNTEKEAVEALAEYRIAFGNDWQLRIKKERGNNVG